MSRKSSISLSNRALFYPLRKNTLQPHEESQNSNVVKRDLFKQETVNSSFPNLPARSYASVQRVLRYPRIRVCSQTFEDGERPNKSNVTNVTAPLSKEKVSSTQPKSNQHNLSYLSRVFSRCSKPLGANRASLGRREDLWLLRNPRDISVQWFERVGFTFSPFAFIFGTTFLFAALANTLQKQDGKQWLQTLSHTKLPGLTDNKISQTSSWVFLESVLSQYINRDNSLLVSTTSLTEDAPYSAQLRKAVPRTLTFARAKPATGAGELGAALEIQLSPIWSQHIKKDFLGVFPLRRAEFDLGAAPLGFTQLTERSLNKSKAGRLDCLGNLRRSFVKPSRSVNDQSSVRAPQLEKTLIWPWYKIMAYHAPNRAILPTWTDYTRNQAKGGLTDCAVDRFHPVRSADGLLLGRPRRGQPQEAEQPTARFAPPVDNSDSSLSITLRKILCVALQPKLVTKKPVGSRLEEPVLSEAEQELRWARRDQKVFAEGASALSPGGANSPVDTGVERLRLEDDSIPSKKDSVYSKKKIHHDTLSARVLNVVKKSFYDYGLSITEDLDKLVAERSSVGPKGLESKNENLSTFGKGSVNRELSLARSLTGPEGPEKPARSSYQAKSILADVLNVTDQPEGLRETGNLRQADRLGCRSLTRASASSDSVPVGDFVTPRPLLKEAPSGPTQGQPEHRSGNLRRGRVSGSSENSSKPPRLSYTKSGGLALIFRNLAIPKKSFWEYAHSISGYNFPELQDYEVADLFGKVTSSTQSKVGLVDLFSEASRQRSQFSKADKMALTPPANQWFCIDTNQVFLTPYLVKVPPKVLLTASNKTEGLTGPRRLTKTAPWFPKACSWVTVGLTRASASSKYVPVRRFTISNPKSKTFDLGSAKGEPKPSFLLLGRPRRGQPQEAENGHAKLRLPETFVEVVSNMNGAQVSKGSRLRGRPREEDFKIRYTPLELEQENKLKKAFKELGRDYSDYLKQPKDSLPALLLSPSLEEDKQIEEEEVQRLAQEKAAAKAAAKRTKSEEEDSISDSEANQEEFNPLDPLEVALIEGKNDASNLEEEPLNDEEIEDSRFERLRFTREIEAKKEEEDCRGLALSLPCRDSTATVAGLARARQPLGDEVTKKFAEGEPVRAFDFVRARNSPNDDLGLPRPELRYAFGRRGLVSDRKHSFFGQRSFWPTRLFSQEERLVSAHTVNPYIRYDQSNPWLIPQQGGVLPVTSQTKRAANCGASEVAEQPNGLGLSSVGPEGANSASWGRLRKPKSSQVNHAGGRLLLSEAELAPSGPAKGEPCKIDDLQNLKNLQTQARLGLVRFVHLPVVEAASLTDQSRVLLNEANPEGQANRAVNQPSVGSGRLFGSASALGLGLAPKGPPEEGANSATRWPEGPRPLIAGFAAPEQSAILKAGNQNRIYKSDPRLRLTPLESSISADWRDDRKGEASPFRVTSKDRPHIVLPQLSENEWQKSLEWQLRSHFLDEDTRLEPLVATEPYKTFKVKRIERSLPWLTLEKPSFKLFQWPYKTVGVLSGPNWALRPSGPWSPTGIQGPEGPRTPHASESSSGQAKPAAVTVYSGTVSGHVQFTEDLNRWSTIDRPLITRAKGLPVTFFEEGSLTFSPFRLVNYSGIGVALARRAQQPNWLLRNPIPLASSFATYSKGKSALSAGSTQLFDVTKKLFSSQDNLNTELLFEPPSTSSWFLIYRLFLALILKEVFKYIYRISLKDFFIRIINSDFGRTITSPEFRQSVQFEPFPEFYKPKNRLKDLIGIKNALLPLSEIIWFLRNNCRSRNGPHGVVLLGPEGVDTTAIAQAVAGEAKVPIIVQSLRALTLTHSHPQKRLEKVLLLARAQSPCVLFLDELDVIGQSREGVIRNTSGDGNYLISLDSSHLADGPPQPQPPEDQATSQGRRVDLMLRLLTVMDGLHHLNGVVIITTSKNAATLDPALLRPGRFDRLIHLTLPNHEDRMELFKMKTRELGHTDQMPLAERSSLVAEQLEYLSLRTANMGGADIVSAINYSVLRAIVNNTVHTVETLEYGLNCVKALKEKRGQPRYKSFSS